MIAVSPLKVAFYQALSAAPHPVYTDVPAGARMPYYRIGASTATSDIEIDEDTVDATITLHAWSDSGGDQEAEEMLEAAADLLAGGLEGAWSCTEELREVMEDVASVPTSRVHHGVSRWRVRA